MDDRGWGRGGIRGAAGAASGCAALAALVCLQLLAPVPAAAESPFTRGSWEVATGVSPSGLRARTLGYFLADRVEVVAHFADVTLTSVEAELPDTDRRHREMELDAAVSVPAPGPVAPYLGLGGRRFALHDDRAPGVPAADAEGTDLHGLTGVRVLVGRSAALNLVLRAGTRRFDDRLAGTVHDGTFADLAVSLSRFF